MVFPASLDLRTKTITIKSDKDQTPAMNSPKRTFQRILQTLGAFVLFKDYVAEAALVKENYRLDPPISAVFRGIHATDNRGRG